MQNRDQTMQICDFQDHPVEIEAALLELFDWNVDKSLIIYDKNTKHWVMVNQNILLYVADNFFILHSRSFT